MNTRRNFLQTTGAGFGYVAFTALAHAEAANPLAPKESHFPAKAKRVIFLCMRGAPSHVDTFDYKPALNAASGKDGRVPGAKLKGSQWKFSQHGASDVAVSELFPKLSEKVDDICFINSMHTDLPAHPQAFISLHTGNSQFVRPSLGAWTLYGLGTMNQNLPGFITIAPPTLFGSAQNYGSSFLPAIYQGTRVGVDARPIVNARLRDIKPPASSEVQRAEIGLIQALNREKLARDQYNPAVEGAIESFELAFKMQSEMPEVMDIAAETQTTLDAYGIGEGNPTDDFGRKCLLARRMIEAGVRFVEVTHSDWDHHFKISQDLPKTCEAVDQPIAALLADLKSRGMLDDTLVVWSGEFGRTPHSQGADGRDHNNKGYTAWMAGGGVKSGMRYGATDELGYEAVEDKTHIHDLHATILHLLGLDHEQLTFRYAGRDFRLTDVKGIVAKKIVS